MLPASPQQDSCDMHVAGRLRTRRAPQRSDDTLWESEMMREDIFVLRERCSQLAPSRIAAICVLQEGCVRVELHRGEKVRSGCHKRQERTFRGSEKNVSPKPRAGELPKTRSRRSACMRCRIAAISAKILPIDRRYEGTAGAEMAGVGTEAVQWRKIADCGQSRIHMRL
jgi:hypothetical protein